MEHQQSLFTVFLKLIAHIFELFDDFAKPFETSHVMHLELLAQSQCWFWLSGAVNLDALFFLLKKKHLLFGVNILHRMHGGVPSVWQQKESMSFSFLLVTIYVFF